MFKGIAATLIIALFALGIFTTFMVKAVTIEVWDTTARVYYFDENFALDDDSNEFNKVCVASKTRNNIILLSDTYKDNKDYIVNSVSKGCGVEIISLQL